MTLAFVISAAVWMPDVCIYTQSPDKAATSPSVEEEVTFNSNMHTGQETLALEAKYLL